MRSNRAKWVLGLSVLVLIGVYFYIQAAIEQNQTRFSQARPAAKQTPLQVSVIRVEAKTHAATLSAVGIAQPHYNLTLTSQVSGEVTKVSDALEAGTQVKAGDVLLQLTNQTLLTELASAKNQLAAARLSLQEEQRQVEQANAEWRAAGLEGEPDSELVLREPQLNAARSAVEAAEAALTLAQSNVDKLTIRAPFDGIIVASAVSLGSYLGSGADVATVYSADRVNITLPLSAQDWQTLPPAERMMAQHWPATVQAVDQRTTWPGYVKQAALHVDAETGLRNLYVAVDQPLSQQPPLLPGSYVKVSIAGAKINHLWKLPNSALSQRSQIWYIDDQNRLASFDATPRFVDQQSVYISVPKSLQDRVYQVLTHPYNSYLTGMLVTPQESLPQ